MRQERSLVYETLDPTERGRRPAQEHRPEKELEAAEKRIAELSAIFKRLYEDSVTGRISDERFSELSADYEAEQRELKERAAALQANFQSTGSHRERRKVYEYCPAAHHFEELTPTLLREFVEKIIVHECSYDGRQRHREARRQGH